MFWTPPSKLVYSMTNAVPLIHLVRHRQLKFLGHILRMSKKEPARRYALYIPTIGKRRPGRPRTPYLNYVQRLLGDNEGAMQEQQITAFADDRRSWRNLVVACFAADGWWWWWWWWWCFVHTYYCYVFLMIFTTYVCWISLRQLKIYLIWPIFSNTRWPLNPKCPLFYLKIVCYYGQ